MKKLKAENYKYLLSLQTDINNYVTNETIELLDHQRREAKYIADSSKRLNEYKKLSADLIKILLSENEEQFNDYFAAFKEYYDRSTLDFWFNTKADIYLELFELVETDEANTGTDSETREIPTEAIPDKGSEGD